MSNVLNEEKKKQVLALGQLGWSLRQIEKATGIRRETAGGYLKAAGIGLRPPGGWGKKAPPKPANAGARRLPFVRFLIRFRLLSDCHYDC